LKQIAILGLGYFGRNVLEELLEMRVDVFIVDKERSLIDRYKDHAAGAVVLDVLNVETLRKILPDGIDAVVIDLGDQVEASILAASYCKKLKIGTIIVKAETESHGEILELVGATRVIFPNQEAAKRITPLLFSSVLLSYFPVSGKLVIAELAIPENLLGKKVGTVNFADYNLSLISVRTSQEEFSPYDPEHVFSPGDVGLFSGSDEGIERFTGHILREKQPSPLLERFRKLFIHGKK